MTQTKFLQGLSPENIEALAKIALAQTYQKNEVIFWQGDEGRGAFDGQCFPAFAAVIEPT